MKSIKIQINRLGAVQNSTLELKPLMIFSGESGLGKSYVAILVRYFYKLLAESRLQGFFNAEGWDYDNCIPSEIVNLPCPKPFALAIIHQYDSSP